jgi:NADH:ubiquinone oxidoreductase subunit 6 (subunit J)
MIILVYAGAVVVLFFFVVMLFDGTMALPGRLVLFKFLVLFVCLKCIFVISLASYDSEALSSLYGDVLDIPGFFSEEDLVVSDLVIFKEAGDGFVGFYESTNLFVDVDVFFIVSYYLYTFCVFEFYVCGLMLFICMISVPAIIGVNKNNIKKK